MVTLIHFRNSLITTLPPVICSALHNLLLVCIGHTDTLITSLQVFSPQYPSAAFMCKTTGS